MTMSAISAYNILVVAPTPFSGNWIFIEEFIKELLSRGHKVTALTCYGSRRKHDNYSDIVIPALDIHQHCKM